MSTIRIVLLAMAVLLPFSRPALAQEAGRERVVAELEMTDRRIAAAQELLDTHETPGTSLQSAYDLQSRARSALDSGQPVMALRWTRDARAHADRVIAELRGLPSPDRVAAQVERARDVLDRAESVVAQCAEPRARRAAAVARRLQERAEEALRLGRYLAALQLSAQVRDRSEFALRLCNAQESAVANAETVLRKTDDLLAGAREELGETSPEASSRALAQAEAKQLEAWREFRRDRGAASIRLSLTARSWIQRALRAGMGGRRSRP